MKSLHSILAVALLLTLHNVLSAQPTVPDCAYDSLTEETSLALLGKSWGYTYDSLGKQLNLWKQSPYVTIDSIGASVQGRALWQLTITSPLVPAAQKQTVFIHARTHPGEVQAEWVANEMIGYLLSEDPYAIALREHLVFYIVPMYNPDGVELEKPRENANDIDLEREWDKSPMQPEPAALKRRFLSLMNSQSPIRIALNLHSAYTCKRYFVFHDPSGTSQIYADLERKFVNACRAAFDGIQPWNYNVTWVNETPTHFPESFYWLNYNSAVLALTYEDGNCTTASAFDTTARAILRGVGYYLNVNQQVGVMPLDDDASAELSLRTVPNILRSDGIIEYTLPQSAHVRISLQSLKGGEVKSLLTKEQKAGSYRLVFDIGDLPTGVYYCRLVAGETARTVRVMVLR